MEIHQNYKEESVSLKLHEEVEELRKLVKQLSASNKQLADLLETDVLTGVLNRRGLQRVLTRELRVAEREGRALSCAIVDLDNFKLINDQYGHAVGDDLLVAFARRLGCNLRNSDYLARIGGDEFIVLMPGTDLDTAQKVLTRCTSLIGNSPMLLSPQSISITMSSAVIVLDNESISLQSILHRTSAGLRNSKKMGKNRVSSGHQASLPALSEIPYETPRIKSLNQEMLPQPPMNYQ